MYGNFARVYDKFMADTPYDEWLKLISRIWAGQGFDPAGQLILELGCGTGNMTHRLRGLGCDVIGLDSSPEMLAVAAEKTPETLYLCQDMRRFELYGTVDGILCICDGINYLKRASDVYKVFKLVKNYLNPGGAFIFDVNTKYKYEKRLGSKSFSGTTDSSAYIWDNYYDKKTRINEYLLNFFILEAGGQYTRHQELHYQRAYGTDTLKRILEKAELCLADIYDESGGKPTPHSERLFFVAINYP